MGVRFFDGLRPQGLRGALRDALAGVTLASMNISQVLGYTRIVGTPVVTGLYTVFLPLIAFAIFGSSRHLAVAADSATASIFASGLTDMAKPETAHYMDLVEVVALLIAGLLLLARIFRLGFLADFLSRTVLVGFLTSVGFQVGIAMLGSMLGIPVSSPHTLERLVVDAGAVTNLDFSAARTLRDPCKELEGCGTAMIFGRVSPDLRADMERHDILAAVGADRVLPTLHEALALARAGAPPNRGAAEGLA
jgi:MFS superfamily sulfate permease-like transporter